MSLIRNDRYLIYKVKVPRDYYNEEVESQIKNFTTENFLVTATNILTLKQDGYYINPNITITAVNNTYSIHPGTNRYLINRIDHSMPDLYALIINRYGTTKEMIEEIFGDAEIYEDNFVGFFQYKNNSRVFGHGIKPFQTEDKDKDDPEYDKKEWYNIAKDLQLGSSETIRFTIDGKPVLDYGLGNQPTIEKEIKDFTEFGKIILEYFS